MQAISVIRLLPNTDKEIQTFVEKIVPCITQKEIENIEDLLTKLKDKCQAQQK